MADKQIEDLINELPFRITCEYDYKCSCGAVHRREYNYELRIEILPNTTLTKVCHRYLVYYKIREYGTFANDSVPKSIGVDCGYGKSTIKEAIEELKGYLNDKYLI